MVVDSEGLYVGRRVNIMQIFASYVGINIILQFRSLWLIFPSRAPVNRTDCAPRQDNAGLQLRGRGVSDDVSKVSHGSC